MMQDLIKQTNKKSSKSKKRDKLRNNKKKIFSSFVVAYQQDNFRTEYSASHIQLVSRACCRHALIWFN